MDSFIASIREADKNSIATTLGTTLPGVEPDDLRRIHFLRRLRDRVLEVPDKQARLLAIVMAERTKGMFHDEIAYQVLKGVVLGLAARFQGTPNLQEVLGEVVRTAGSDGFAAEIVYSTVTARDRLGRDNEMAGLRSQRYENSVRPEDAIESFDSGLRSTAFRSRRSHGIQQMEVLRSRRHALPRRLPPERF